MDQKRYAGNVELGAVILIPTGSKSWAVGWVLAVERSKFWMGVMNFTIASPDKLEDSNISSTNMLAMFLTLDHSLLDDSWSLLDMVIPPRGGIHFPIFKLDNGPQGFWLTNYLGGYVRQITEGDSLLLEFRSTYSSYAVESIVDRLVAQRDVSEQDKVCLYTEILRRRALFTNATSLPPLQ